METFKRLLADSLGGIQIPSSIDLEVKYREWLAEDKEEAFIMVIVEEIYALI